MKKVFLFLCCGIYSLSFSQITDSIAADRIFSEWNMRTPGAALGIVKDGKLVYAKGYGSADLEHDLPISPSSVFYIGSVSKQFVTFCVLLLEEQGKLNLDDQIQKYLPDFPEYDAPLTVRHFIHHTSGVRDYLTLMYLKGRDYLDNSDVDEVYELIKSQKELNFTPGDKYLYSNSCYFMLAMIIEKASGQTIKEFAAENIFKPLKMENTQFYDNNLDLVKNRVFSYRKNTEGSFDNLIMRFDLVGSGGVYSSVEDLYLWDQNFYHNILGKGGQGIIDKMHEEGILNNGESAGYAFALHNDTYRGLRTVHHAGALAGYRAQLLRFPKEKTSVIILANRADADPTGKAYKVADIILRDKFIEVAEANDTPDTKAEELGKASEKDISEIDMQIYIGEYYSDELNTTYKIYMANDSLQLKIANYSPRKLTAEGDGIFDAEGYKVRFKKSDGNISGFEFDVGRVTNLKFERI
ncbi:serine hydrolase domain-containing protein [Flagellimonas crocea]|uniref:serine hydrolase domain-containing protein n=1 Tax=Flagellimonas crocea TaxID=3067311 RepID=UPI00296FDB32|nr:serine hydrolase domain-containing protein [Muricauda sp. DH64]